MAAAAAAGIAGCRQAPALQHFHILLALWKENGLRFQHPGQPVRYARAFAEAILGAVEIQLVRDALPGRLPAGARRPGIGHVLALIETDDQPTRGHATTSLRIGRAGALDAARPHLHEGLRAIGLPVPDYLVEQVAVLVGVGVASLFAPTALRRFCRFCWFTPADQPEDFGLAREEVAAMERLLEVEEVSPAPALRMAEPLAGVRIDREVQVPALVDRTGRAPFTTGFLLQAGQAGAVVLRDLPWGEADGVAARISAHRTPPPASLRGSEARLRHLHAGTGRKPQL